MKSLTKQVHKSMKKVLKAAFVAAAVVLLASAVSSCKSSHDCSSYGEVEKFQKEVRR